MTATTTIRGTRHKADRKADASNVADDILRRAFSVVEKLTAEYPTHALADIRTLNELADRMAAESDRRAAHYQEIFRVAHDIRGQGTLFGYPLITRCADSLCLAVRRLDPDDGAMIDLVRTHTAAFDAIIRTSAGGSRERSGDRRDSSTLFVAVGLEFLVRLRTQATPK